MTELFNPAASIAIALFYVLGIRSIKKGAFKILYSLAFTITLLIYFPVQVEFKTNNLVTTSYITLFVMLGPLAVNLYKYLKFRDFEYFYEHESVYTSIHCLITGPICEEFIFRHVIFQLTNNNLAQALVFAMVHISSDKFMNSLLQSGFTFIFGLWAGIFRNRFGIEGSISSHLVCNWIGFPDYEFFLSLNKKEVATISLLQIVGIFIAVKILCK